jgi:energy-coupling factor transporter ATP-binding protein EcfA2
MLYKEVVEQIIKNKETKKGGGFIGIPYPFPRLSEYVPVISKGESIGVLGATGSGKSRFCRYVFLYNVYKFYKQTGYKVKIIYLPLEDNKTSVYRNILCNYLYEQHGIYISLQELDSKGDRSLPDFVEEKLIAAEEYFKEFESIVHIVDGISTPDEILDFCKKIALKLGTFKKSKKIVEGEEITQTTYESDTHVILIVDNISNLDVASGSEEQASILKFCKDIVREKLCNILGWTVVQVLQLDFTTERQQYTKDGETIVSKLEPSLAGIGDSKRASRSMHLILSLFHPDRYGILKHPTPPKNEGSAYYDIEILGNRYRSLKVLKSNNTDVGQRVGLYFDAIAETFTELPKFQTDELMQIYNKIKGKPNFIRAKNQIVFKEDNYEEAPF